MSGVSMPTRDQPATTKRPMSERSVFILQELLKLRRLSRPQFAALCRRPADPMKLKMPISRLRQRDLINVDYMPIGRKSEALLKLTETGHRHAAISMGRDHDSHYRDYVNVDFLAHLLMGNELYLRIVAQGASDWAAVRHNAGHFEWLASNEDTSFIWEAPAEFKGERKQRRVVPDITIETEATRYLVEIERSTKTQTTVGRKIESYCHLFSPLRSAQEKTGYALKYADGKKAVVVFVFTDERRALNARAQFERRAKAGAFYIPAWKCGTVNVVGDELRRELLGRAPTPPPLPRSDLIVRYRDSITRYVVDTTKQIVDIEALVRANRPVPMPVRPPSLPEMYELLKLLKAQPGAAS